MAERAVRDGQLLRFIAYGFLKNQQYYAPFLVLMFRAAGLSFTVIGLLIGWRELLVNLLEIPSGAAADLYGRRRTLMVGFVAFVASFAAFALAGGVWGYAGAMTLFAVGEAMRTGTFKAMFFDYLDARGLSDRRTEIYGHFRGWAKLGSAVSVAISAAVVLLLAGSGERASLAAYRWVFWACCVPYGLALVNFACMPAHLDASPARRASARAVAAHLLLAARQSWSTARLRRLMAASVGFEGVQKVARLYLQPIVRQAALALPILLGLGAARRTAVLIAAVYIALHLLESAASRRSQAFQDRCGGLEPGASRLWGLSLLLFAVIGSGLGISLWAGRAGTELGLAAAIGGFLGLAVLENLWRPIQLGRLSEAMRSDASATVLSIESQAKSLFAAATAPLLGAAVDAIRRATGETNETAAFLPVAALGLATATGAWVYGRRARRAG